MDYIGIMDIDEFNKLSFWERYELEPIETNTGNLLPPDEVESILKIWRVCTGKLKKARKSKLLQKFRKMWYHPWYPITRKPL